MSKSKHGAVLYYVALYSVCHEGWSSRWQRGDVADPARETSYAMT
jgi:hypothetical protein